MGDFRRKINYPAQLVVQGDLTPTIFLALPPALEMSNVHWSKLNLNAK